MKMMNADSLENGEFNWNGHETCHDQPSELNQVPRLW